MDLNDIKRELLARGIRLEVSTCGCCPPIVKVEMDGTLHKLDEDFSMLPPEPKAPYKPPQLTMSDYLRFDPPVDPISYP